MSFRIEKDTLGEIQVPSSKYWGAQTQRSIENFKIGSQTFPLDFIKAYALVKLVSAEINNELGILDESISSLIIKAAQEVIDGKLDDNFPLVVWQTGSGTQTNMNINEVISNRAIEISGGILGSKKPVHPNDHVNKSQSTNDTFPTALNISIAILINEKLLPSLEKLENSLSKKSLEFDKIIKLGRTHLQDATPISLGQVFSGYESQIQHSIISINNALKHIYELPWGGTAVGTGLNSPEGFSEMVATRVSEKTNLPFITAPNKFESIASHDSAVSMSSVLKTLASSLNKIGNDLRWLSSGPRSGIGEIILPTNEPGSSIMPGKINPTQVEALSMIIAKVIGNDVSITFSGASGNFELNVYRPILAYSLIESVILLSDGCNSFRKNCVEGIIPNKEKIKSNLDNSLMLVTALAPYIGYDKSAQVAKYAYDKKLTLRDSVIELNYMSGEDFDKKVNPEKMINPYKLK
tara:strand:- start:13532 stop:14929 length:1398 start_codon:yes stop_codon:yes gene_type:complete